MKWIEVIVETKARRLVFIKHIHTVVEDHDSNRARLRFVDSTCMVVEHTYDQVKDMIAACYGAEDEED